MPGARGVVKSLEVPDFDALMAASAAITRYGRSLRIPLGAQITADRGDEHSSSRPEESAHLPRCTVQSHVKVDPPRFAYLATPGAHDLSLLLPTDGCELGLREVVEGEGHRRAGSRRYRPSGHGVWRSARLGRSGHSGLMNDVPCSVEDTDEV